MRVEGYTPNPASLPPVNKRPVAPLQKEAAQSTATGESAEVTPHEKLRRLLEEKRTMSEAAFENPAAGPELGKHIDLRV
jgi:hypothetical protein